MFESFDVPDGHQSGRSNALLDEYVQVQWKPNKADDAAVSEAEEQSPEKSTHGITDKPASPVQSAEPESKAAPSKSISIALAAQAEYIKESKAPNADKEKVLDHLSLRFQGAIEQADDDAKELSVKLGKELDALIPEKREQAHHLFDLTVTAQAMAISTVKPEERDSVREEIVKARHGDKDALTDLTKRYPFIPMALNGSEESAKQFGPVLAAETEMLAKITSAAQDEISARLIFADTINDAGMDASNYVKDAVALRDKLIVATAAARVYMSPKVLNLGQPGGEHSPEHQLRKQYPDEQKADDN